jgi:hypothetical protein
MGNAASLHPLRIKDFLGDKPAAASASHHPQDYVNH